ncbi:bifunctional adenosylcobinamide kinase/adenosylcobinamide-phosphate guanylyltransferase [Kineothrix sp. MB12-C1]|uniref:bifunctional adenosylcobinamide kinase/adenosylcobinamide-phosphate guanylyltransferase n=1 Tax=Kineothrix sp. MB12-C1 TaxID=3070215 RepID=UPI0027D34353|nr:bifunctional adenosylcobinamide kinase/adenosylcobinamide-phosphate guanylyltransferase [Kineothrix sp. MB12-C1]WMC93308.1 bifunctional adenosylcobinamide kinase/adenosylcobinamide-phosphate guanylyltransferase [Kineothrix sp. MB12-C1]
MELYIGGYAQGKLAYVLRRTGYRIEDVMDGGKEEIQYEQGNKKVINNFHEWFRRTIQKEEMPEEMVERMLAEHPDMIIIGNEIGNGIVPMDEVEREYRERLGRCLCEIAGKADKVERIICGLGQRIK